MKLLEFKNAIFRGMEEFSSTTKQLRTNINCIQIPSFKPMRDHPDICTCLTDHQSLTMLFQRENKIREFD